MKQLPRDDSLLLSPHNLSQLSESLVLNGPYDPDPKLTTFYVAKPKKMISGKLLQAPAIHNLQLAPNGIISKSQRRRTALTASHTNPRQKPCQDPLLHISGER